MLGLRYAGVRHSMLSRLSFSLRVPFSPGVTLHVGISLFVPRQCVAFAFYAVRCSQHAEELFSRQTAQLIALLVST